MISFARTCGSRRVKISFTALGIGLVTAGSLHAGDAVAAATHQFPLGLRLLIFLAMGAGSTIWLATALRGWSWRPLVASGEVPRDHAALPAGRDPTADLLEALLTQKKALAAETALRQAAEIELAVCEEKLRQAQKMEAVGRLAGGVAHDFNNLLTAILGYAGLIETHAEPGSTDEAHAREIIKAGEHAGCLTHQLLAFSRNQGVEAKTLEVNDLLDTMQSMIRRLIGEIVDLNVERADEPLWLKADPTQLQQIIFNLAINARDAMPLGGRLSIQVESHVLPEPNDLGLLGGEYVSLAFSDEGTGISADVIEHIFEPFFTTKAIGQGTGLGLATVHGIVEHNGGGIQVKSQVGAGTTFTVYLPAAKPPDDLKCENEPTPVSGARAARVLVVEDDDIVRQLVCRVLKQRGYEVLSATNGEEALGFGEQLTGLNLVLTDVVMPRLGGVELRRRLRSQQPELPVILMSGYSEADLRKFSEIDAGSNVLKKPFGPEVLTRRVREAIDFSSDAQRLSA